MFKIRDKNMPINNIAMIQYREKGCFHSPYPRTRRETGPATFREVV